MLDKQVAVREFMQLAGQECPSTPTIPDVHARRLRLKLIEEELAELDEHSCIFSINSGIDLAKIADDIADLLYVVYGAAVAWGIDIEPVFQAVHTANMAKFGPGSTKRADGKWIKSTDWKPPDIKAILDAQGI